MEDLEYSENGNYIQKNFVPESGQAEFVQGELLRVLEKLRNKAYGNINFDEKCHRIFVGFLKEKLNDKDLFDNKMIKQINKDLNALDIKNQHNNNNNVYKRIHNRIVDWYFHYYKDGIKHKKNSELDC